MIVEHRVAGVLLAAGAGSRLGQPKATVELGGEPLAGRGIALLRDGGAQPVVIVTGAVAVDLPGVLIVHNPDWRTGMGSSLAAGLATVPDDCGGGRDRPGRPAARRPGRGAAADRGVPGWRPASRSRPMTACSATRS